MNKPRVDVTDVPFGRLIPKQYLGGGRWRCVCKCSAIVSVYLSDLKKSTKSCGCLKREAIAASNRRRKTHGLSDTPEYHIWEKMLHRCNNKNDPAYHNYGGRGICVCKRWRKFEHFIADMGVRPSKKHTLERKENDGNYCPDNCVWVTRKVQARNRRTNRVLTFQGRMQCLEEWSEETGIHRQVIWDRLNTGWSVVDALTTPTAKRTKRR